MLKFLVFSSNRTPKLKLLNYFESAMTFYAVAKGRKPGIYSTWDECKAQVNQFSGPIYKKFKTKIEAENFIEQHKGASAYYPTGSSQKTNTLLGNKNFVSRGISKNPSLKRSLSTSNDSKDEAENAAKRQKCDAVNAEGFIVDDNGYTEVYTDGACTSNGRGNAKAGVGVWFSDNHPLNISQPVVGRATNNMAEIQAVTMAARQAHKAGIKKLKVNTDSKFLISCITQWMPKWKRCGWKTANGKPVINKEELLEMEQAIKPLQLTWNHVRGHVGIHGNEMADKLAREGSESYRKK